MPPRSLKSIIADHIEAKDVTIDQLIAKTGVPEEYVRAIMNNHVERLPALPYIRTHLLALADFLDIQREVILEAYRSEFASKISGPADRLPGNRFAFERRGRRWVFVGLGALFAGFLIYAVLSSAFFGAPYFRLVNPPEDADIFEVNGSTILLAGTTEANGKLTINGEMVPVRADGSFEFEFSLSPELNTVVFMIERFLGKTLVVEKKIFSRVLEETSTSSDRMPTADTNLLEEVPASTTAF